MNYLKLKQKIYEAIERNPLDRSAYEEMFAVCREYEKIDFQTAHAWNHELRNHISWGLRMTVSCQKFDEAREFDDLMFRSLLFGAQHFFDDYLQAVEYGKPLDKKFYQPRRHYLRRYVDAYQEILDGKLDFLSISMPKRAGKSQLGINFTNMLSGKYPDRATLMEGTGDDLVKSFYLGCLEYLTLPSDYHFYDIFPESKLVQTNADTKIINLLHKSRFPTVMCRSIDARQVGLSEATNLLYLDDCVEGREEAKNRQRLDDKWEVISGDIIGRAIEGTPIVICGTRYSLYDPMIAANLVPVIFFGFAGGVIVMVLSSFHFIELSSFLNVLLPQLCESASAVPALLIQTGISCTFHIRSCDHSLKFPHYFCPPCNGVRFPRLFYSQSVP